LQSIGLKAGYKLVKTGEDCKKTVVCGLFAVHSGFFGLWEKAHRLQLWLRPLSIKKPDQTRLSNTRTYMNPSRLDMYI